MEIGNIDLRKQVMIVAELSANHGRKLEIAVGSIRAAKKAGVDAIKLQTYNPDTITIDCDNEYFQIRHGTKWDGRTLYDLYKEAYLPWEWHEELFKVASEEGLECFSSPFDRTAVDLLNDLGTPAYKIASFEITDIPLIKYVASIQKPVIMSTGIASEEDIQLAVDTCRLAGNNDIVLLKCTSEYPATIENANIQTMVDLRSRFGVEIGLSDHSMGNTVPVVATALGARLIEKHFILDKNIGGPDAHFSLDPDDFVQLVKEIRNAEMALGSITYELPEKSKINRKFSRSLFVVKDVKKGDSISPENVRSIRPSDGIHPKYYDEIMGQTFNQDLMKGTPLSLDHFDRV